MAALAGVRIIDFTWAWAGPYATLLLSFLGAEVIKIESLRRTDVLRRAETRLINDPALVSRRLGDGDKPSRQSTEAADLETSVLFHDANLNKRSVRLDLTQVEGAALAKELVAQSDVVVENFSPGVMRRFGLDYEALRAVKPDLIMLSASAAGATGPERSQVGFAVIFNALSGLGHLTGYTDGLPGEIRDGIDLRVGVTAAFAILAALCHRQHSGHGQYIDLSAREAITALIGDQVMDYTLNGRLRTRLGNGDDSMAPHGCYRCHGAGEWITIAVSNDGEWERLCQLAGHPEWQHDPRFRHQLSRWRHRDALDALLQTWTAQHSADVLTTQLQKAGIAAAPSYSNKALLDDPHLRARDQYVQVTHPVMGSREVVGPPWRFSQTPPQVTRAAPLLGQDSAEVLQALLHLSPQDIADLHERKILF